MYARISSDTKVFPEHRSPEAGGFLPLLPPGTMACCSNDFFVQEQEADITPRQLRTCDSSHHPQRVTSRHLSEAKELKSFG